METNLQQLVQQGAVSVPAIREFLEKNADLDFGAAGSQALGFASLRRTMFDALQQIGGPEAVGAMAQVCRLPPIQKRSRSSQKIWHSRIRNCIEARY